MSRAYDIVKTEQDLSYLAWDEHDSPSGLLGSRLKAREGIGANAVFYKQSHTGKLGFEQRDLLAELICSRVMDYLGIEHVPLQLVRAKLEENAKPCWVIKSKSYRATNERGISLADFYDLRGESDNSPLDLCKRMGWSKYVADVALSDFLTATRSRDASCFEVLSDSEGNLRLSPCMPRAYSLANAFPGQTWRMFAVADISTENYLGASSLEKNLELVPPDVVLPPLNSGVRKRLFAGLQGCRADQTFFDACWHILEGRWACFEKLRHL